MKKQLYALFTVSALVYGMVAVFYILLKTNQPINASTTTSSTTTVNIPVRGQAGDAWADIVIGKPDFGTVAVNQTVNNKMFWSSGVIVDKTSTPNKLYVYDANNNRILGINLATCLATQGNGNCAADLVIGQPSFNTSGCNGDSGFQNYPQRAPASSSTLCGQPESVVSVEETGSGASMSVDPQGNLYVVDYFNNRVLKYNRPFDQWLQNGIVVANDVWGQNDFTGNLCNKGNGQGHPDATSLCYDNWTGNNNFTAGVEIDSQGNMWVTDNDNERVLRFPNQNGVIAKTADVVIGQPDFTSTGAGSGLNQFNGPAAVRMNSRGWIYVADEGNSRYLVFENPVTGTTGRVFASNISPNPFEYPEGVDFDPSRPGKVWLSVRNNRTIELWDEDTQTKVLELGRRGDGNVLGDPAGSLGFDSNNNLYYAMMSGGFFKNDIVMYSSPSASQIMPDKNFFGASSPGNQLTQSALYSGKGVAVSDNQLIVEDDSRILFWNLTPGVDPTTTLSNGQPADGLIIGTNYLDRSQGNCCTAIKADKSHHLYVARITAPYRIDVYNLPLTNQAQPFKSITFPLTTIDGQQIDQTPAANAPWGIVASGDSSFLWIADTVGNRVIRIRNPLTNPVADVILGQTDLTGLQCNRGAAAVSGASANTLCRPGSLSLDKSGNLWVSDHSLEIEGNMRLLEFNANVFPANNTSVLFAPDASKIFANHATFDVAFDSQNHMVAGFNPYWPYNPTAYPNVQSKWPAYYLNPLSASTTPDGFLKDYSSLQFSAVFDDYDNLYIGDINRGHILIYKKPFVSPSATPVPPTNTPTPTNTPVPPTPTPVPVTFQGQYWNNKTLSGTPVLTRNDATINFDWGTGSPDPKVTANNFSARWTETLTLTSGTYKFTAVNNDGMRAYLDGTRIYNSWSNRSSSAQKTFTKSITSGTHTIKVEYYENTGSAVAKFSWVKQ